MTQPKRGETWGDEVKQVLVWCFDFLENRDRMNAAVHTSEMRESPLTTRVREMVEKLDCPALKQETCGYRDGIRFNGSCPVHGKPQEPKAEEWCGDCELEKGKPTCGTCRRPDLRIGQEAEEDRHVCDESGCCKTSADEAWEFYEKHHHHNDSRESDPCRKDYFAGFKDGAISLQREREKLRGLLKRALMEWSDALHREIDEALK